MESKLNRLLLSKSTFYPEKNEKLPEIGMIDLPKSYEKVNHLLIFNSTLTITLIYTAVPTDQWKLHQIVLCERERQRWFRPGSQVHAGQHDGR